MANPLSPLNDFIRHVLIMDVDPTTGLSAPATSGDVTGFLATSDAPDAIAADPAWTVSGVYIGGANDFEPGMWQLSIDGAALTPVKCRAAFMASIPYFIVERNGDVRQYEKLKYVDARKAIVE